MQTNGLLRRKPPLLAMTCWITSTTIAKDPAQRLRCEKWCEEEGGIMLERELRANL